MSTTVSPFSTLSKNCDRHIDRPISAVNGDPVRARSRKTLTPARNTVGIAGVRFAMRSPIATPPLRRSTAVLPYNAGLEPQVAPPMQAAGWQKKYARAAARAVLPSSGSRHWGNISKSASNESVPTSSLAPLDDFVEACFFAQTNPDNVATILNRLTPEYFLVMTGHSVMDADTAATLHALQLLSVSGNGCDAITERLPSECWNALQLEALQIWLQARHSLQTTDLDTATSSSSARECAAARHALLFLVQHPGASAAELGAALREASLLVPYFNRKHGFTHASDIKLAQHMLRSYGVDLQRAYKLRTSWRARYHPRRLWGGKKSAFAAMTRRMHGLRRDLAQRECEQLDRALHESVAALFKLPQHERILRAMFQSAPSEHKLEIARQIVVLRHLHARIESNRVHGITHERPFFSDLTLTRQELARATLLEVQRLTHPDACEHQALSVDPFMEAAAYKRIHRASRGEPITIAQDSLGHDLAPRDAVLLRALQDEARMMLTPSDPTTTRWKGPSVEQLRRWHTSWLAAMDHISLRDDDRHALSNALNRVDAQLQIAERILAPDSQMRDFSPTVVEDELNSVFGTMHNHSATFYSGAQRGLDARVVLSMIPGVGVRPKLKRMRGDDAVITEGQSLSGSFLGIGRRSRTDTEIGVDAVLGTDAFVDGKIVPVQANISLGVESGRKQSLGIGLMIRADKLTDANGKVVTWNAARQADASGVESNRWTMQRINSFLLKHCEVRHGKMEVPREAEVLWEEFAANFFDSPNLQLSVYNDTKQSDSVRVGLQLAVKAGTSHVGVQATVGARLEWTRERQRSHERSTRHAALSGGHQTGRAAVIDARVGAALPSIKPDSGPSKISTQPIHGLELQGRFAEHRHQVQFRLQHVNGKLANSSFCYEIVSSLAELRRLIDHDAKVWHGMANGQARLDYFYAEYQRSYGHLPNTVFYLIRDLRAPAARRIDALSSQIARIEAHGTRAPTHERIIWQARLFRLERERQQILEERSNWTPYAIDVRQNVTLERRHGVHLGVVAQHLEGVEATHMLMRLTAKPEQRHAARVRFEEGLQPAA
jgi:hypothetical protein